MGINQRSVQKSNTCYNPVTVKGSENLLRTYSVSYPQFVCATFDCLVNNAKKTLKNSRYL
jgi:hypothetical protein